MELSQAKLRAVIRLCRAAICRALAASRAQQGGQTPTLRLKLALQRNPDQLTVTGKKLSGIHLLFHCTVFLSLN